MKKQYLGLQIAETIIKENTFYYHIILKKVLKKVLNI